MFWKIHLFDDEIVDWSTYDMVLCMVKNDENLNIEKFLKWIKEVEKVTKL